MYLGQKCKTWKGKKKKEKKKKPQHRPRSTIELPSVPVLHYLIRVSSPLAVSLPFSRSACLSVRHSIPFSVRCRSPSPSRGACPGSSLQETCEGERLEGCWLTSSALFSAGRHKLTSLGLHVKLPCDAPPQRAAKEITGAEKRKTTNK